MTALRRSRWALSFADLCLLLLGFFVMLQAGGKGNGEAVAALSGYFGGTAPTAVQTIPASALFEPGEAMLTAQGRAALGALADEAIDNKQLVEVASVGEDKAGRRFDRWELAAARLAAVARSMREAGLPEQHIRILGLQENDAPATGQHILIRRKEARSPAS